MERISQLIAQLNNEQIIIGLVVAGIALLLIIVLSLSFSSTHKKKKCYKVLDQLRERIIQLKGRDIIHNYTAYDHLRNDKKLGMLIVRWKKSIESLVQEIDAQFSLIDVLEDAIESRKYKNFYSLADQVATDVEALERRADELDDEISEYVHQANDNRKYIHKYQQMYKELVSQFRENQSTYRRVVRAFEKMMSEIEAQFNMCEKLINESRFEEADQTAAKIFDAIKTFDFYLEEVPKIQTLIESTLIPKFEEFLSYYNQFTHDELQLVDESLVDEVAKYQALMDKIERDFVNLHLDTIREDIDKLESFLNHNISRLNHEHANKTFIDDQIKFQKEYLEKLENNAKNFISLMNVIHIPYDEKDREQIENMLPTLKRLKAELEEAERSYLNHDISFTILKEQLEANRRELETLSRFLDDKVKVVDHVYRDEKKARDALKALTEKINGTKKFIKIARLQSFEKDLQTITDLNSELTNIYLLLSEFPIDIVRVNEDIERMTHKVEETTKTINSKIYKALLAEFALVYGNRYYHDKRYRHALEQAQNAFMNEAYDEAKELVFGVFDQMDEKIKREVLDRFQQQFQTLFS
ncbi:MAG TPA: septation ring formation regulator EzrA [Haloplasmataceae bacterium]